MTASGPRSACPDAEALAAYVESRLDDPTGAAVERHVASCGHCLDVVAAVLETTAAAEQTAPRVSAPPRAAADRPRRRGILRGAIAAGLAFVVTAAVAYGAVQAALHALAAAIAGRATVAIGEAVNLGGVRITLDRDVLHVALDHLTIGDAGRGRSSADSVELSLALAALARGRVDVARVRIVGATMRFDLSARSAAPRRRSAHDLERLAVAATIAPVELVDATIVLDVAGAAPVRVERVGGTITPEGANVRIALTGTFRGGELSARGTIGTTPAAAVDLELRSRGVDARTLPLATLGAPTDGGGDVALRVAGPLAAPRVTAAAPLP